MFEYIDISENKIAELEKSSADILAAAGLMVLFGISKKILTVDEGLKQAHNLFLAIMSREED